MSALEEAVASLNEEMDRLDAAKREAEEPEREAKARFDVQWEGARAYTRGRERGLGGEEEKEGKVNKKRKREEQKSEEK